jgi:hypothetical protein
MMSAAVIFANTEEPGKRLRTAKDYGDMACFLEHDCGVEVVDLCHDRLQYGDVMRRIRHFFSEQHEHHVLVLIGGGDSQNGFYVGGRSVKPADILSLWAVSRDCSSSLQTGHLFVLVNTCYDGIWATAAAQSKRTDVCVQCSTLPKFVGAKLKGLSRDKYKTADEYQKTFTQFWLKAQGYSWSKFVDLPGRLPISEGSYFATKPARLGRRAVVFTGCQVRISNKMPPHMERLDQTDFLEDKSLAQVRFLSAIMYVSELDLIPNRINFVTPRLERRKALAAQCLERKIQFVPFSEDSTGRFCMEVFDTILKSLLEFKFWNYSAGFEMLNMLAGKVEIINDNPAASVLVLCYMAYWMMMLPMETDKQNVSKIVQRMVYVYGQIIPSKTISSAVHTVLGLWSLFEVSDTGAARRCELHRSMIWRDAEVQDVSRQISMKAPRIGPHLYKLGFDPDTRQLLKTYISPVRKTWDEFGRALFFYLQEDCEVLTFATCFRDFHLLTLSKL